MKRKTRKRNVTKWMSAAVSVLLFAGYSSTAYNALAAPVFESIGAASESNVTEPASVTKFGLLSNKALLDAYNAAYKMDSGNIQSMKNNGGSYPGTDLNSMLDGHLIIRFGRMLNSPKRTASL